MKLNYASVGDIVFVRAKGIYVAEVVIWFDEPKLSGHSSGPAHKVSLSVRFAGSENLPFSELETKAIRTAEQVLGESASALRDATGKSLAEFVETADQARSAKLRENLTASIKGTSNQ